VSFGGVVTTISLLAERLREFAGSGVRVIVRRRPSYTTDAPVQLVEAGFEFPESLSLPGGKFQQGLDFCPVPKAHVESTVAGRSHPGNPVNSVGGLYFRRHHIQTESSHL
jgi:hypothetical protein